MRHWFDGLAMLHRFTIADGRVSYGSRFLDRPLLPGGARAATRSPTGSSRPTRAARSSSACRRCSHPAQAISDNANVNVTRLGERFVAMTETPMPVQFDAQTLRAAGTRLPGARAS